MDGASDGFVPDGVAVRSGLDGTADRSGPDGVADDCGADGASVDTVLDCAADGCGLEVTVMVRKWLMTRRAVLRSIVLRRIKNCFIG